MRTQRAQRIGMVTLSLVAVSSVLARAQAPPKNPEQPFKVFVFTKALSDPDDGNSVARTAKEVGKKLEDRKKWFRLVSERDEADIVVEVLDQTESRRTVGTYTPRPDNTAPGDPQITNIYGVGRSYLLETRVFVSKAEPFDMNVTADGNRPRDSAKPFAQQLHTFCRLNYWTLMKALER